MLLDLHYTTETFTAFLLAFIPGLINLSLAAYVFFRLPSRLLVNIFILVLVTSACWQFANAFMRLSADAHTARFWDCFFGPVGLFSTPLLLHFALVYTDKIHVRLFKYTMYVMYLVFFVVTSLYGYVNTLDTYQDVSYWGWVNTRADIGYAIIAGGLVVLYMFANVALLFAELPRTPKGSNKFKGLVLIGGSLLIIVVQVTVTELLFPIVFNIPPAPLTPTVMLSYSIGTFIALTVYHFFPGEESIDKTDLLNAVSDIIIVVNSSMEISYVNRVGLEQIGAVQAALEGENVAGILQCEGQDEAQLATQLMRYAEADTTSTARCYIKTIRGETIPVLVKTNAVHGDTSMGGYILLCRNIGEIENVQEETRRNDRRFRKIIERAKDAMAIIDKTGHIIYASPSAYNVIGYSPAELEGRGFIEFIHPDHLNTALSDFEENLTTTLVKESTSRVYHKSGREIWLETVAINYFDDPDVNGLVVVFRDITERMQHLEEIRRHSAYLEQLFEASPFGIAMLDEKEQIINVNKAFEGMFQYSAHELTGRSLTCIVPPEKQRESKALYMKGRSRKAVSHETVRQRKDGKLIDVYLVAYPIVLDDNVYGAYVLYLDISNQKQYENEIVHKNEELTKINHELDQFVYSASHDIRSPLMSILGLVNIAGDEISDPEAAKYLGMIKDRVLKLDEFTLDIIHFARNSRTGLKAEPVLLEELLKEAIDNLKHLPEASKIRFVTEVNPGEYFSSDRSRLYLMLSNLISNAIKYHRHEIEDQFIKISAYKEDADLVIKVADNGEGIDADKQSRIFEMFTRFSTRSKGSGLGLYIVKEIVEKLGGEISVRSEKNLGSAFTVKIPEIQA